MTAPTPIMPRSERRSIWPPRTGESTAEPPDSMVIASISTMREGWKALPSGTATTLHEVAIIETDANRTKHIATCAQALGPPSLLSLSIASPPPGVAGPVLSPPAVAEQAPVRPLHGHRSRRCRARAGARPGLGARNRSH